MINADSQGPPWSGRNPELTSPGIAQVLVRCVELCFAAELRQFRSGAAAAFSPRLQPGVEAENMIHQP